MLNRMGYFGEYSAGVIYGWNDRHSVEFSLGVYSIDSTNYTQSNLAYRYSQWTVNREWGSWTPLQFGIFAVRSWDSKSYFRTSPAKYPYKDYYDETALRWGFEFGTVVMSARYPVSFAYYVKVLDTGLVAIYNNGHKDLQYHIASGVALRYHF